jgi:ubiquinone/menaquinone biosynthesis C-methylase UbiE
MSEVDRSEANTSPATGDPPPRPGRQAAFDGALAGPAASLMAVMNRDMELAAVEELATAGEPPPRDVLAIGFGPGVGIAALVERFPEATVTGIDPARTMVRRARQRNRRALAAGRVVLHRLGVEAMPFPDDAFGAALAVNNVQLWRPLEVAAGEVARVLRPGGRLVTLTHTWAIEKACPEAIWTSALADVLRRTGFVDFQTRRGSFRSGSALVATAVAGGSRV